jgi:hypothetical protein
LYDWLSTKILGTGGEKETRRRRESSKRIGIKCFRRKRSRI